MLGLPSTTEVNRRISKEAFYAHMKLPPRVRESFVRDVESVEVAHSIKATTAHIADGERVHEVLVMRIALRTDGVPVPVIDAIDSANPGRKVFVCARGNGEACLAVRVGRLVVGPWAPLGDLSLDVSAATLDDLWDGLASQVVYGDSGRAERTVEERYALDQRLEALRREVERTEAASRRERQFARKNELFARARKLRRELEELERGM